MPMRKLPILLLASAALFTASLAHADDQVWVKPLKADLIDGWTASLNGDANLTFFGAWQSGHESTSGTTASVFVSPKLEKLFANEWRAGFSAYIDAYHDRFSGDNYGNRAVAKAYGYVSTPYGDLEIGQQDGAAYKMAVTGPLFGSAAAIDDANITFFRDPATGQNLRSVFDIRSAVFSTANDAKISLYTPRLLGVELGVSYTPGLVKGFPFADSAPHVANRQSDLIDAALNYTGYFGKTSLGAYAGLSAGHNAQRTAGYDDLIDWAIGSELDYDFDDMTLAIGGAYRQTNSYDFDQYLAFAHGMTHAVHGSSTLTCGKWKAGVEYSGGRADAEAALPQIGFNGYELTAGYAFNDNLQATAGWQHEHLTRSTGAFYTGGQGLNLNAAFLYIHAHI